MNEIIPQQAQNKGFAFECLPSIMFPEDNEIIFFMDFQRFKGVPHNIRFYPLEETNGNISFFADGYGILQNNKWNIRGSYGNGSIYILLKDLPGDVVEWCRKNYLT